MILKALSFYVVLLPGYTFWIWDVGISNVSNGIIIECNECIVSGMSFQSVRQLLDGS
jgi:hypothetical protein